VGPRRLAAPEARLEFWGVVAGGFALLGTHLVHVAFDIDANVGYDAHRPPPIPLRRPLARGRPAEGGRRGSLPQCPYPGHLPLDIWHLRFKI